MRTFDLEVQVAAVRDPNLSESEFYSGVPGRFGELDISVMGASAHDADLDIEVLSEATLEDQVRPSAATGIVVQTARLGVFVDGVEVPAKNTEGGIEVERDYDNLLQGWSFASGLEDPDGHFGDPFTCYGPSLGISEVDICGIYRPSGSEEDIVIPLIKGGSVDNSTREGGPGGNRERFTGVDRGGRFDGKKITVQFPPGHGLPRGRVLREIFTRLGETQMSFEDGQTMMKELQLIDAEPLGPAQEIEETENRKVLWDSEGYAVNPQIGRPRPEEAIAQEFEEKDILQVETVSLDPQGNVITLVVANGTEQVTEEECAHRVDVNIIIDLAQYTPQRSLFRQNPWDGISEDYDPISPVDPSGELITFRRTETTRKYRCEQLYEELVRVWEWKRNEVPRYHWDDDAGGIYDWRQLACYTDDDDGVDGGEPGYLQQTEIFQLVSEIRTFYIFAHEDFTRPINGNGGMFDPLWDELQTILNDQAVAGEGVLYENANRYGQAVGYITLDQELTKLFGKIKGPRTITTPMPLWEDTDPVAGTKIWGDGNGVGNLDMTNITPFIGAYNPPPDMEAIMPFAATIGVFGGDKNGYLDYEQKTIYGHRAKRGRAYYYGDNDSRGEASERFQHTDTEIIRYITEGGNHSKNESFVDEITGRRRARNESGLPGDRPAVAKLDIVPVNDEVYEGDEVADLPKQARRRETRQVSVTVPFDFLTVCHWPKEVVTEFPWAENMDELRAMATYLVEDSAAMPVRWTVGANFLVRECQVVHLTYRPLAIDHDVRVKRVAWAQPTDGPIFTKIEARLYPW